MDLHLEPGVYVVAVSGGVDSVALLDMLVRQYGSAGDRQFIAAHFDHGIRPDSDLDRQLVQTLAARYGLPFVYDRAELGPAASEDVARRTRYAFLHRIKQASGARAIITAHHQDDVLETAVLNMLRGTGWRGLASLRSHDRLKRPLLNVPKNELITYAKKHDLSWREDITNKELRYVRNYIRHKLLPRLTIQQKQDLLQHIRTISKRRGDLEEALSDYLRQNDAPDQLDRRAFIMLPHQVAREIMATWLKQFDAELSAKKLELLVSSAKTLAPGRQMDVDKKHVLHVSRDTLKLAKRSSTNKR